MGRGLLKVLLVDAKGLAGNDFLGEPVDSPPRMFLFRLLRFAPSLCPAVDGHWSIFFYLDVQGG
jgi:hypothetical protein